MKGKKVIIISILFMLFLAIIPSSQASHSEQTTVETEPTLNSDLYMGFGILIILLIILFLGFMSYQKEGQVPPKAQVKRKKKSVKKVIDEEPDEEEPVKKKAVKKKAVKGSKTYTSNNVEIVELTRRKKRKVKRKKRKR